MTRTLVTLLALVALASPAAAAPQLSLAAQRGRVTVYAERGLEDVAHRLAASAEATLDRISTDLIDLPTPTAIEVRLVADASDLDDVAPGDRGAPPWAIGVAYPDLGIVSVAMRRGHQHSEPITTLRHELAHIALGTALGKRAPRWLHEGFAYQHSADWSWARAETLAGMAWFGSIIPLEQLDFAFPAEELPAHRAYAQSYDFVGYLSRRGRWEDKSDDGDRWPFRRFLVAIGNGADPDTAARREFGRPLSELFDEWRADLTTRYLMMPVGLFGLAMWILCALLLVFAFLRRRRQNRRRIAQWDREEATARERDSQSATVQPPPYIPWPGEDPLSAEFDDEEPTPGPRTVN